MKTYRSFSDHNIKARFWDIQQCYVVIRYTLGDVDTESAQLLRIFYVSSDQLNCEHLYIHREQLYSVKPCILGKLIKKFVM